MCGIVGYVGSDEALPIVLEGLRRLEYRGYDSAGIAVVDGGLSVVKRAGKLARARGGARRRRAPRGSVGMGHTRWATHGAPTDRNAHPHLDCTGRVAVIHNGIVENFQPLRDRLEKEGHALELRHRHRVRGAPDGGAARRRRRRARRRRPGDGPQLEGAYSLVVCSLDDPETLVGVKVSSPLVVGLGDGETILASDIPAILGRTDHRDPDGRGADRRRDARGAAFTDLEGAALHPEPITVDWDVAQAQKSGYDSFMRKEIDEQPAAIRDTLVGRVVGGRLQLDELHVSDDVLREVSKVFVVACGTAFHSGMVAKYAIEHWTRLPVEIEIASEFRYRDPVLGPDTLTLAVSQSRRDDRHARGRAPRAAPGLAGGGRHEHGGLLALARGRRRDLHARRDPEIGVAATKTFATQMVSLHLVALYLAQVRGTMFPEEIAEVLAGWPSCPSRSSARCGWTAGAASSRSGSATRATCCSSAGTPAIPPRSRAR